MEKSGFVVTIRDERLKLTQRQFEAAANSAHTGPMAAAFKQWRARLLSFWRRRFMRLSRGGGEWPPLSERTKRQRAGRTVQRVKEHAQRGWIQGEEYDKKLKAATIRRDKQIEKIASGTAAFAILVDTGTLIGTLDPAIKRAGQISADIPMGIKVGIGGGTAHPAGPTIGEIATKHQRGEGVPKRTIIVKPDDATIKGMLSDMVRAFGRMFGDKGNTSST